MQKKEKMELIEDILKTCLFSEYLPVEFSSKGLTKDCFTISNSNCMIAPITFTMDKFNDLNNRRYISIPDVGCFINAVNSLCERNILEKLVNLNNQNTHSLSKIVSKKNEIKKFSDGYIFGVVSSDITDLELQKDFLDNTKLKLEKSKGCECILHLDISNFYNSIYTHNITAITKGETWANEQYQLASSSSSADDEYKLLANIDSKISSMNLKRTHGLLTGPRLSFILAESLLTRIDFELEEKLKSLGVDFVRYVDDYDVFVKSKDKIKEIENVFNEVLQKYGLSLNDMKMKIEDFPYYAYKDFSRMSFSNETLENIYSSFAIIEKQKIQNGGLLYFCQNILPNYTSSSISLSLSFSILKNVSKALVPACTNIYKYPINEDNSLEIYGLLIDILNEFVQKKYDLESVWVLYTLLKLFPQYSIEQDVLFCNINEIALVVYIYESQSGIEERFLIDRAKNAGWLLNYELYFNDVLNEAELMANLKTSDISIYKYLKDNNINFYKKRSL